MSLVNWRSISLFVVIVVIYNPAVGSQINMDGITVRKIWSNEHHNAFTSLIKFKGSFYCSFRQGSDHAGGEDGVVRIIRSNDGKNWKPVAVLEKEGYDLRDPKLSVTPDGNIMVLMGGSVYRDREIQSRLSHVSFSDRSGNEFQPPQPVIIPDKKMNDWLWRVTWHDKTGYGVVYRLPRKISLIKTSDGINYELVKDLDEVGGGPNESTVRIMPDGEMFMMVRRASGGGLWGRSRPPYTHWSWVDAGMRFGGPDFVSLADDLFIAGTRVYEEPRYTGIFLVNRAGLFREILRLPSGGDNSYPGFVVGRHKIYVSYYSSHEGNTSIYFAEIPLSLIEAEPQAPLPDESRKIP
jgi:hypothetical protein